MVCMRAAAALAAASASTAAIAARGADPRVDCAPLPNSVEPTCMPWVNFGTGSSTKFLNASTITTLTRTWLAIGGHGIDTAFVYKDEESVGEAIAAVSNRSSIFVTTKVPSEGFQSASDQAAANRKQLGVDSVDLLLVHFPSPNLDRLYGTWEALVNEAKTKHATAIGVSNFALADLKNLERMNSPVRPAVNQIYAHVGCMPDKPLVDYCAEHGIRIEAYSPLGRGKVLTDPTLTGIAKRHSKSPAQVALQYLIQKGIALAFTTTMPEYMRDNLSVVQPGTAFKLNDTDIVELDAVNVACERPHEMLSQA
mmetsp:Transcript_6250/g.20275  ORF Transcript_6250/g.20275 Transcript_6250/m.20275 type:complete len:310 (+) Transcript_6250:66-995(+)